MTIAPSKALLGAATALALVTSPPSAADEGSDDEITRPGLDVPCVLEIVLRRLRVPPRSDVPLPEVLFGSTTPLHHFQDAIAPQWGFRPHVFANAYVPARNEIYLLDAAGAYPGHRTIDDSLAHELTHYVQVKYLGMPWDELAERQAVAVQNWFREERARGGLSHESCEAPEDP